MTKPSKMPKTNDQGKILKMVSRNEQFERNGGGQFVAMTKAFKNKKKYDRKQEKNELRKNLSSFYSTASIHAWPSLQS